MEKFNFELPSELKLDFNIIALKTKRSMADITRELIEAFVKEHKADNA